VRLFLGCWLGVCGEVVFGVLVGSVFVYIDGWMDGWMDALDLGLIGGLTWLVAFFFCLMPRGLYAFEWRSCWLVGIWNICRCMYVYLTVDCFRSLFE